VAFVVRRGIENHHTLHFTDEKNKAQSPSDLPRSEGKLMANQAKISLLRPVYFTVSVTSSF
jgi:hypothetical protein